MNTALAMTLLHLIWQGAAIALVLAIVLQMTSSARLRYVLACCAMLSMLAAFGITFAHFMPSAPAPPPQVDLRWITFATSDTAFPTATPSAAPPWWLAPAWIVGASLFSLRSLANWIGVQRLQRIGVCAAPPQWQARMRDLAARVRVSRPVSLLESCLTEVPVVIGCIRPVILFPAGLMTGLPAEQIEYFLIHELAHVRRWDYLANLLQTATENLLFYHPAVWWISSVIRAERENCCDDVAASFGNAREFAAALVSLESSRALRGPVLAANGGSLMQRVRRMLGQPEPRSGVAPAVLAGMIAAAIAFAAGAPQETRLPNLHVPVPKPPKLLAQARSKNPPVPTTPDATKPETPYQKWLDQEAVYIISDAERNAFRNLQSDEERQQFIEQFWLRRDPTPGTQQNDMQEEHYRRIAYANDHFGTPTVAGWTTDRGKMYIKFGPPDEMEAHTETAPARELWLYRFIQGIGTNVYTEFVDENRTGEYHMTKDPAAAATPARPLAIAQLVGPGGRGGGSGLVSVRSRVNGTVSTVLITDGQFVTPGQVLVELQSPDPTYNRIISPTEGFVHAGSISAGGRVEAGQELFQIVARTRTTTDPISYFEAETKSLQYQAGFETGYLNQTQLSKNGGYNSSDPAVKALQDASRQLSLAAETRSPNAQAALERLRTIVEKARAARLGTAASNPNASQTPWWAPDPQNSAALSQAIELTAVIQADGRAQQVSVARPTDTSLNRSAIDAVQSWRFPVLGGGRESYTVRVLVDPNKLARR
jgi:GWxTD domain-containing protein